jgi:monoamine oxidase
MARTPLAGELQRSVAAIAASEGRRTRRQFLRDSGVAVGALAGLAASGRFAPLARGASAPQIAIVGGGLAGLTCAYRLKQAGVRAQIYEASGRIGGRCWSIRDAFVDGQIAEHGGELIDQGHIAVRNLAQELGLRLDNLLQAEANGAETLGFFDGKPYHEADIVDELKQIWQQIHADVSAASYPTLYNLSTKRGRELDAMSITEWIEAYVPGGTASRLGKLLAVAYTIEYGGDASEQSSLNMLYLLGYSGQGQLRIFGKSNEKYHVTGGNDQIPARLAEALGAQITTDSELVAVERRPDGTWRLSLRQGGRTMPVTVDRVVFALPFAVLRASVDLSKAAFSSRKRVAIQQMGMGTSSKLHVQFSRRFWEGLGANGETFSDTGYQNTWEVTRAQRGRSGILVDFTGGTVGAGFGPGSGSASSRASKFLAQLEPVLPGATAAWNGRATLDWWLGYPWTHGSYSYWKTGQYTLFAGAEREREPDKVTGTAHFCGEHTSIDFQGYLNGAVETGERVAGEMLADLK